MCVVFPSRGSARTSPCKLLACARVERTDMSSRPALWNGRIWPRRECKGEGTSLSCLTGNVDAGLEPADNDIAAVNLGEWNLVGWSYSGSDLLDCTRFLASSQAAVSSPDSPFAPTAWDISAVPGFTVPMSVIPANTACESVSCLKDLNPDCPDERMQVKGDAGSVIACLSACFASINAVSPSSNCW
jgi:hypothetical protein